MIEVDNLTKVYPNGHCALDHVDLSIGQGVLGLLGPNGAGKTTLMRILATLLRPTSGRVVVFGNDLATATGKENTRRLLGYLPQEFCLHQELSIEQELDCVALLKGIEDPLDRNRQVSDILERVGLKAARRERVKTLSGGMKRRLGIGIALLGNPRLIIVDEPTAGLDPAERVRFRNLLFELAGERVVILSTHIVEDINQVCAQLAILLNGKIILQDSPKRMINQLEGKLWSVPSQECKVSDGIQVISSRMTEDGDECRVFSSACPASSASPISPTLEDAYLLFVGKA